MEIKKHEKDLFHGNLRLVLSVVQRFGGRGENPDDLFQIGCIGLIKAIDNFDLNQNVQFSTYAVPMIIGEIRSVRDLAYKALGVREKIFYQTGKEATVMEISKELNVSKEEIAMALDSIQNPTSLQEPVYNDGAESIYIMDQVKDTKNTDENWTEDITIKDAMSKLNDREKMIIMKRFFDGRTQMEVAEEIGISQAQVSRLEKGALDRMKKMYK